MQEVSQGNQVNVSPSTQVSEDLPPPYAEENRATLFAQQFQPDLGIDHPLHHHSQYHFIQTDPAARRFLSNAFLLEAWRMFLLTLCFAGYQFTWTVEMSYGTPYLLSLGISKPVMSLVWLAGPLSGLIMQPVVGSCSDKCTSPLGRRRPYMIGGCIAVFLSFLMIGWTREITGFLFGITEGRLVVAVAVLAFYLLDFAINSVQASCRALIVDVLPPSKQESGNAWAGRMIGFGNVFGYFMGFIDLVSTFPILGNTQLKVLCMLASLILFLTVGITSFCVRESVVKRLNVEDNTSKSPFQTFFLILKSLRTLPKPIQRICNTQFFAWIGWFPFLFYSTTWVSELYVSNPFRESEGDIVGASTRAGSFALFLFALVSLTTSCVLPLVIESTNSDGYLPKTFECNPLGFDLPRCYTFSHLIFAMSMIFTLAVSSVGEATVIIAICGFSWAVTLWAPFSLIGEYLAKAQRDLAGMRLEGAEYHPLQDTRDEDENQNSHSVHSDIEEAPNELNAGHSVGLILGIHNMYIVLPQFIITFISSIIFYLFEPNHTQTAIEHAPIAGEEAGHNPDAIGWVLRIGGLSAIGAALFSLKIKQYYHT